MSSVTDSSMLELIQQGQHSERAAETVTLFCDEVSATVCIYAHTLGGLDTLVFTGGIGENSPLLRARICEGLHSYGLKLNELRNTESTGVISTDDSGVTVRVMSANEEFVIARSIWNLVEAEAVHSNERQTPGVALSQAAVCG